MNSFRHLSRFAAAMDNCCACGQCVPVCPAWKQSGNAADSPRGLLALLRVWMAGELPDDELAPHLRNCVMCGLCNAKCPAGLPLQAIFVAARQDMGLFRKSWSDFLVEALLRHPRIVEITWQGGMLLANAAHKAGMRKRAIELPSRLPFRKKSGKGGIALFAGCLTHFRNSKLLSACARVLDLYEADWQIPEFACCGAFAFIAGRGADARRCVRHNLKLFEDIEPEYILTPCPHCLVQITTVWPSLPWLGKAEREKAAHFASRMMGFGQFLNQRKTNWAVIQAGIPIYWHDACAEPESETRAILNLLGMAGFHVSGEITGCCGNSLDGGKWSPLEGQRQIAPEMRNKKNANSDVRMRLARNLKREIDAKAPTITAGSCPGCLVRAYTGNLRHWLELLAATLDRTL